jgi:hypothetical protein
MSAVRPSGFVIASGFEMHERDAVVAAFGAQPLWAVEEDGWVGLIFRRPPSLVGNSGESARPGIQPIR